MLSGTCNGYTIQYFKEIKIKLREKSGCSALFLRQFAPRVIYFLRLSENRIDIRFDVQLFVKFRWIAFIGKGQLTPGLMTLFISRM